MTAPINEALNILQIKQRHNAKIIAERIENRKDSLVILIKNQKDIVEAIEKLSK